jgi:hypothetical protein
LELKHDYILNADIHRASRRRWSPRESSLSKAVEEVLTALKRRPPEGLGPRPPSFELLQKPGILQYMEYEPPPKERCTSEERLYEEV